MRRSSLMLVVALVVIAAALPAGAITRGGSLDGDDHPYVGIMVASIGGVPQWRCSGTLISPTVYVTAGHCTSGADAVEIWFETDLHADETGGRFGYPFSGPTSVSGTPHTYPEYLPNAFYFADLGVVVLDEPVNLDEYASLPTEGLVDTLGNGRKTATVTVVGYGLQSALGNQQHAVALLTRHQAELFVVDTNGVAGIGAIPGTHSMVLSGDSKHGGTCFGDSGGPTFIGDTLVGVTSFGLNSNCGGIGGAFRIDFADEIEWISSFN